VLVRSYRSGVCGLRAPKDNKARTRRALKHFSIYTKVFFLMLPS
jgi:hypothetical protein